MRRTTYFLLAVGVLMVGLFSNMATAHAWKNNQSLVTICHANGNGTYTEITVNKHSAAFHGNNHVSGHADHAGDVIPPFTEPFSYGGQNWTEENASLWAAHKCPSPPSTTTSQAPVTTTTVPEVTSTTQGPPVTIAEPPVVEIGEPASVDHNLEQPVPLVKVAAETVQPEQLPRTGANSGLAVAGGLVLVVGLALVGLAHNRKVGA